MSTNSSREKIHVKNKNDFIEAHVNRIQKKTRTKPSLTYFWYKSRSINYTKGGYAGRLLEGKFNRFSLEKKLIEQGQFKKGLKKGKWISWFKNGELKSICSYRKGLKHGKEIIYNELGNITSEIQFNKGEAIF